MVVPFDEAERASVFQVLELLGSLFGGPFGRRLHVETAEDDIVEAPDPGRVPFAG